MEGPGTDLRIFEIGYIEKADVLISTDSRVWRRVGTVEGGTAEVDISPVARPGEEFAFVKLCDSPGRDLSAIPGADIDAVGAIHSVNK
jgi:hypothetical protein